MSNLGINWSQDLNRLKLQDGTYASLSLTEGTLTIKGRTYAIEVDGHHLKGDLLFKNQRSVERLFFVLLGQSSFISRETSRIDGLKSGKIARLDYQQVGMKGSLSTSYASFKTQHFVDIVLGKKVGSYQEIATTKKVVEMLEKKEGIYRPAYVPRVSLVLKEESTYDDTSLTTQSSTISSLSNSSRDSSKTGSRATKNQIPPVWQEKKSITVSRMNSSSERSLSSLTTQSGSKKSWDVSIESKTSTLKTLNLLSNKWYVSEEDKKEIVESLRKMSQIRVKAH